MSKASHQLKNLLAKIRDNNKMNNLQEAADTLSAHEWNEIDLRIRFFKELGSILRSKPIELEVLRNVVQKSGSIVLGGHSSYRAQINSFLKSQQALDLIDTLLGERQEIPDHDRIDDFIRSAVEIAFHGPSGKPKNRSGAALFASVLLTSTFPDHFVDYRHDRWQKLAKDFELESLPEGAKYSDRLFWAGRLARQFSEADIFRMYFKTNDPIWTVSGLAYLFAKDENLKELVKIAANNQPIGGDGLQLSVENIWHVLRNHNPQVVLQGPPGSGKTYLAEQVVKHLAGSADLEKYRIANKTNEIKELKWPVIWDVVQFHPSYGYEDFVRGLVTVPTENGIEFKAQNRILAEAAEAASKNPSIPVVLILDEINRADLSRVLGELIYVLERDRRGQPVSTQYAVGNPPDRTLRLPPNLYFIATMNTADRSIALVDYAIRRRFSFFSVLPSVEVVEEFYSANQSHQGDQDIAEQWAEKIPQLYQAVFAIFDSVPDADDIRIGHSYFMVKGARDGQNLSQEDWADAVAFRFAYEVIPMLNEYRKERKLRSNQYEITTNEQSFSLQLNQQQATYEKVKAWLME